MLHIHNGESTAGTLKEFGFPGKHFAFQEVLMCGPTPASVSPDEWRKVRRRFLIDEYELNAEDYERNLHAQDEVLRRFSEHEEVTLWFEHDLFCQISLIYLLDWLSRQRLVGTKLTLVCVGELPGIEDFRGLGQLTGEQLASLFDSRHEVTEKELSVASEAWAAYCSANPEDLTRFLENDTSAMPFLGNALRLHLMRFPSVTNGLGLIEQTALEIISDGAIGFKSLFPKFAKAHPVYGLGDAQFWSELKRLSKAKHPVITVPGLDDTDRAFESNRFHEATCQITDVGRLVLAGENDFVELNGIDLWLGGVHLRDGATWRWNQTESKLQLDKP